MLPFSSNDGTQALWTGIWILESAKNIWVDDEGIHLLTSERDQCFKAR